LGAVLDSKDKTERVISEGIAAVFTGQGSPTRFQCTFKLDDGPQSLIVAPEPGAKVPNHKKAEIEMHAARCVANCGLIKASTKDSDQ
jgi:hypothetical protein